MPAITVFDPQTGRLVTIEVPDGHPPSPPSVAAPGVLDRDERRSAPPDPDLSRA